jgi:hypothetical protein
MTSDAAPLKTGGGARAGWVPLVVVVHDDGTGPPRGQLEVRAIGGSLFF